MQNLLTRIDIKIPLDDLLKIVCNKYSLGSLTGYDFFDLGYEDVNIKITTTFDVYVVKIFSRNRTVNNVHDYIKGLNQFYKQGIPVPKLYKAKKDFLYTTSGNKQKTFICIMDYFDGDTFVEIKPSIKDILYITKFLAKIHTLSFPLEPNYDSWGTRNLIKEFHLKKKYLTPEEIQMLSPYIEQFMTIDFTKFRHSVIHGDIQREHILKNSNRYCLIDLGCMNHDASILDLGIFLAQFLIDIEGKNLYHIYLMVLSEYQKIHKLSIEERKTLPLLILGTYVIYFIASTYQIKGLNNPSSQSLNWHTFAKKGLEKFQSMKFSI